MHIKKRGKDYYRLWGSVGTKRLAESSAQKLKREGYGSRYFIEKIDVGYRIWYRPNSQAMTKRDYARMVK